MGQHNLKTKTLLGIVHKALSDSNYAIDQYPEFRELFEGQAPANVHARVDGQWHVNAAGQRTRLKTIYEVVTQDPNFGENAQGIVRQAWQRQTEAAPRAPGKTEEQAMEALAGRLVTAHRIPSPDDARKRRGKELIAAAQRTGGNRRG